MSRKAKSLCPGCKTPKSGHDFGHPSKKYTSRPPALKPADSDSDDASVESLTEEIKQLQIKHKQLLSRSATQKLREKKRLLTQQIGLENQDCEPSHEAAQSATPPSDSLILPTATPEIPKPDIKHLRRSKELAKQADHLLDDWLAGSSSSDEEDRKQDALPTRLRGKNRVKSGSEMMRLDDIVQPIKWPHLQVLNVDGSEQLKFADLSVFKLVAGELEILQEALDAQGSNEHLQELKGRILRLKDTMYFSVLHDFDSAKEYFRQVGLFIERGKANWFTDFNFLAKWLFCGPSASAQPKASPTGGKSSGKSSAHSGERDQFDFICGLFNFRDSCKFLAQFGKCNRAHVCLNCFKKGSTREHRALDCPSSKTA